MPGLLCKPCKYTEDKLMMASSASERSHGDLDWSGVEGNDPRHWAITQGNFISVYHPPTQTSLFTKKLPILHKPVVKSARSWLTLTPEVQRSDFKPHPTRHRVLTLQYRKRAVFIEWSTHNARIVFARHVPCPIGGSVRHKKSCSCSDIWEFFEIPKLWYIRLSNYGFGDW